jgi:methionyl-tRNA formyltransferase
MCKQAIRVIFFGSGDFVMPIIDRLVRSTLLQGLVVTKPKASGRGLKTTRPRIVQWAEEHDIKVFMPDNPNSDEFIHEMNKQSADVFILCSYGHILGESLLDVPRYGCVNIHPSLLPKYRGAAPIQRVLMDGEKKTGVTMIVMDEKIDHGNIILQHAVEIQPDDNYGSLSTRLSQLSASLVVEAVKAIMGNGGERFAQHHAESTYAAKVTKDEMMINWEKGSEVVYNLIRALAPYPGARTTFRGKILKILEVSRGDKQCESGVIYVEDKQPCVGTGDGSVVLKKVQPENKLVMSGKDFMNGYHIEKGEVMR